MSNSKSVQVPEKDCQQKYNMSFSYGFLQLDPQLGALDPVPVRMFNGMWQISVADNTIEMINYDIV